MKHVYPFSAIVGQDDMKLAMILTAIDPKIGGVLVFGDRGTGKSTAVRGLSALLPKISVVQGCPINSARLDDVPDWAPKLDGTLVQVLTPVVDLPLGVSEDRVTGALDIERALMEGVKAFQSGLLAAANRGYLYIDEINLLEDHIVDLLLDVAQSGENVVEREGMSIKHPAQFVLIGSGNPEEGDLRPQLLDRFGLSVDVGSPSTVSDRVTVIRRRDAFDTDPAQFCHSWQAQEQIIQDAITVAREQIAFIDVSEDVLEFCAKLCMTLGSDGLRGELALLRAGRALAAYQGRDAVTLSHIQQIAPMSLSHRLRRDPLDEAGSGARVQRALDAVLQ